jgi:hypothetical protein
MITSTTKAEKPTMKSMAKHGIGIGILCLALATSGGAQTMFFRTVSTQATYIVSFDTAGVLTWSNSIPGAVCAVESVPTLPGTWSTFVDPIIVTSNVASIQIPLGSTDPAVPQKYLFEVSDVNYAWAHYYNGLYVEHSGFVYRYHFVPPLSVDPTNGIYPAAFLDAKTATNRMYVGTESQTNLESMLALVPAAGQGQLSERICMGADQGLKQYKAFVYNPQQTNYSMILLRESGDCRRTNSAPEAAVLTQWLSNWWHEAGYYP